MVRKEEINELINIATEINIIYQKIAINGITDVSIKCLKALIQEEKTLYENYCPTIEECVALINKIETQGINNEELDDLRENSINRILNKLKYMYLETTYISNGAFKHIIDKYTQILYSEFINSVRKHPELKNQLEFSAFYILSLSPAIEIDVLENGFVPYSTYNDDLLFFAGLKRAIARQIAMNEKDYKWHTKEEASISGIDHVYRENVEDFIRPYISYTIRVLIEELQKDNSKNYIYSLIELKAQLAMLPIQMRERKYKEIIELFQKENIESKKIELLKKMFVEIEEDIITKVDYIPRGFQNKKASN